MLTNFLQTDIPVIPCLTDLEFPCYFLLPPVKQATYLIENINLNPSAPSHVATQLRRLVSYPIPPILQKSH